MKKVKFDIPTLDGGLITDQDPRTMPVTACTILKNMIPRKGYAERRPGLRKYVEELPDTFIQMDYWKKATGEAMRLLLQTGVDLWECRNKAFTNVGTLDLSSCAVFTDFNEQTKVYFQNIVQPKHYDGTTLSNWSKRATWPDLPRYAMYSPAPAEIATEVPKGTLLAEHSGRLIVAGIPARPDCIYYSEVGIPDLFDHILAEGEVTAVASNWLAIGDDGEDVTAIYSLWGRLYVFKANNRMYVVNTALTPDNWDTKKLLNVGCSNPRTLQICNNNLFFLDGSNAVREFSGAQERNQSKDKIGQLLKEYETGSEFGEDEESWMVDVDGEWLSADHTKDNVDASDGNLIVAHTSDAWGDENAAVTGGRGLTKNPVCTGVNHLWVAQMLVPHKDTEIKHVYARFNMANTDSYVLRLHIYADGWEHIRKRDKTQSGSAGQVIVDFDFLTGNEPLLEANKTYYFVFSTPEHDSCSNCPELCYNNTDILGSANELTNLGMRRRHLDGNTYTEADYSGVMRITATYRTGTWISKIVKWQYPRRRQVLYTHVGTPTPKVYARWADSEGVITGSEWNLVEAGTVILGFHMTQIKIVLTDSGEMNFIKLQELASHASPSIASAGVYDDLYLLALKKKDTDERTIFGLDRKGRWFHWTIPAQDFLNYDNALYILTATTIYYTDPAWMYDGDAGNTFQLELETMYVDFGLAPNDKNMRMMWLRQEGESEVTGYVREGGTIKSKMFHPTRDGTYMRRPIPALTPPDWTKDYGDYCYYDVAINTNKARLYFVAGDTVDEFDFDGNFKYRYIIPSSGSPWLMRGIDIDSINGWIYCIAYNTGAATGRIYRHKLDEGVVSSATYMALDFDPGEGITRNGDHLYFGDKTNHMICRCVYNGTIGKIACPLDLTPYTFNPRHITFDGTTCYMTNNLRYVLRMTSWSGNMGAWVGWYIYDLVGNYYVENLGGINNVGSTLYLSGQRTGGETDYLIRSQFGGANAFVLDITSEDWMNVFQGMAVETLVSVPDAYVTTAVGLNQYDMIKIPFPQTTLGKGFSFKITGNSDKLKKVFGMTLFALSHKIR